MYSSFVICTSDGFQIIGIKCGVPDAHAGARDGGQLDGARETLVTLGIIVLEADLEFDGFEEVSLLLVEGVVEKLLDILAHSGYRGANSVSECSHLFKRCN